MGVMTRTVLVILFGCAILCSTLTATADEPMRATSALGQPVSALPIVLVDYYNKKIRVYYNIRGDYDQNGEVNAADLVPLSLFYGCDGDARIGGRDVWITTRAHRQAPWSKPLNLGPPINSMALDQNLCLAPDHAVFLFTSNRDHGEGGRDIWQVALPAMPGPTGYWNNTTSR